MMWPFAGQSSDYMSFTESRRVMHHSSNRAIAKKPLKKAKLHVRRSRWWQPFSHSKRCTGASVGNRVQSDAAVHDEAAALQRASPDAVHLQSAATAAAASPAAAAATSSAAGAALSGANLADISAAHVLSTVDELRNLRNRNGVPCSGTLTIHTTERSWKNADLSDTATRYPAFNESAITYNYTNVDTSLERRLKLYVTYVCVRLFLKRPLSQLISIIYLYYIMIFLNVRYDCEESLPLREMMGHVKICKCILTKNYLYIVYYKRHIGEREVA